MPESHVVLVWAVLRDDEHVILTRPSMVDEGEQWTETTAREFVKNVSDRFKVIHCTKTVSYSEWSLA